VTFLGREISRDDRGRKSPLTRSPVPQLRQFREGGGVLGVAPAATSQTVGGEDAGKTEGDDRFDEVD